MEFVSVGYIGGSRITALRGDAGALFVCLSEWVDYSVRTAVFLLFCWLFVSHGLDLIHMDPAHIVVDQHASYHSPLHLLRLLMLFQYGISSHLIRIRIRAADCKKSRI